MTQADFSNSHINTSNKLQGQELKSNPIAQNIFVFAQIKELHFIMNLK